MTVDVLCLRPEADFVRAGAILPAKLKIAYRAPDDPDVSELMKQARALVIPAVGPKLPQSLFERTTVKFVQVTGAGVDRLDLSLMKRLGIVVANVPGGSNQAVAEYVVTAAAVLLRRFAWADAEIRAGRYREFRSRMLADNLSGLDSLTVGVVGMGVIGFAVAHAFRKNGCKILYYDPAPRDPSAAEAVAAKSVSLEELLKSTDVITLHVPLLDSTKGLIGARELSLMKPGAILIQASRGGIVDEVALAEALGSGRLGGAAIDVYSSEPPGADNPLLALTGDAARRVLFTPHIAGVTRQATAFLLRSAWRNVERVLITNEPPLDRVS
ncbi:MAG TPA: NAD(P)-dependent oxidoreductase [Candidatus Angelobacter sp.]|nr:NAD(P)-dependent oxidoreductase [Candidatus Angelobacter sp.]